MGKHKKEISRARKAKKLEASKIITLYTKQERERKITNIMLQLAELKFDHVLTPEVKKLLFDYINTGEDLIYSLDLPEYSRTLEINLTNDKSLDKYNSVALKFKKVVVDEDNKDNPINKLNVLQEGLVEYK